MPVNLISLSRCLAQSEDRGTLIDSLLSENIAREFKSHRIVGGTTTDFSRDNRSKPFWDCYKYGALGLPWASPDFDFLGSFFKGVGDVGEGQQDWIWNRILPTAILNQSLEKLGLQEERSIETEIEKIINEDTAPSQQSTKLVLMHCIEGASLKAAQQFETNPDMTTKSDPLYQLLINETGIENNLSQWEQPENKLPRMMISPEEAIHSVASWLGTLSEFDQCSVCSDTLCKWQRWKESTKIKAWVEYQSSKDGNRVISGGFAGRVAPAFFYYLFHPFLEKSRLENGEEPPIPWAVFYHPVAAVKSVTGLYVKGPWFMDLQDGQEDFRHLSEEPVTLFFGRFADYNAQAVLKSGKEGDLEEFWRATENISTHGNPEKAFPALRIFLGLSGNDKWPYGLKENWVEGALKTMCGTKSCFGKDGASQGLSLMGALIVFLGAIQKRMKQKRIGDVEICVINGVDARNKSALPLQSQALSKKTTLAMMEMFERVIWDDSKSDFVIKKVVLGKTSLKIGVKISALTERENRSHLVSALNNKMLHDAGCDIGNGQTFGETSKAIINYWKLSVISQRKSFNVGQFFPPAKGLKLSFKGGITTILIESIN